VDLFEFGWLAVRICISKGVHKALKSDVYVDLLIKQGIASKPDETITKRCSPDKVKFMGRLNGESQHCGRGEIRFLWIHSEGI